MECIRQAKRGKQKEINPKDLLIDFSDVITSKLPVSNKLISKSCPLTKYLKNMVLLVLSNHGKIQIQLIWIMITKQKKVKTRNTKINENENDRTLVQVLKKRIIQIGEYYTVI